MENENEQLDNVKPETSFEVQLYIYDLSRGLAQTLISQLLGECCVCYAIGRWQLLTTFLWQSQESFEKLKKPKFFEVLSWKKLSTN